MYLYTKLKPRSSHMLSFNYRSRVVAGLQGEILLTHALKDILLMQQNTKNFKDVLKCTYSPTTGQSSCYNSLERVQGTLRGKTGK